MNQEKARKIVMWLKDEDAGVVADVLNISSEELLASFPDKLEEYIKGEIESDDEQGDLFEDRWS